MIKDILKHSTKATCGIMEREVNVPAMKVPKTINKLKRAGYRVIGTSYGRTKFKKIWFVRHGGF